MRVSQWQMVGMWLLVIGRARKSKNTICECVWHAEALDGGACVIWRRWGLTPRAALPPHQLLCSGAHVCIPSLTSKRAVRGKPRVHCDDGGGRHAHECIQRFPYCGRACGQIGFRPTCNCSSYVEAFGWAFLPCSTWRVLLHAVDEPRTRPCVGYVDLGHGSEEVQSSVVLDGSRAARRLRIRHVWMVVSDNGQVH